MCDNPESPQRQRIYLQALRRLYPDLLVIVEGKIQATKSFQRLVRPIPEAPALQRVLVHGFNEKKTDVNLAADLISGAWTDAYAQAVVCSNDADLEAALATLAPGSRYALAGRGQVAGVPSTRPSIIRSALQFQMASASHASGKPSSAGATAGWCLNRSSNRRGHSSWGSKGRENSRITAARQ
jgi:hypothetical protein